MERITVTDVRQALAAYQTALASVGIECPKLELQPGSAYYGNSWQIVTIDDAGRTVRPVPVGSEYLGHDRTARSAYDDLTTRTRCIYDMSAALRYGVRQ
jgi:hypothetical protein